VLLLRAVRDDGHQAEDTEQEPYLEEGVVSVEPVRRAGRRALHRREEVVVHEA
jgi:hypothetical protein